MRAMSLVGRNKRKRFRQSYSARNAYRLILAYI